MFLQLGFVGTGTGAGTTGQITPPSSPLDMTWITNPLDQLYGQYGGLFLQEGVVILSAISVIVLVWYTVRHGLSGGLILFLGQYWINLVVAGSMLAFYMTPCPWLGGHTVSGFFPAVAEEYANDIGLSMMDQTFSTVGNILAAVSEQDVGTNFSMLLTSWAVQICMWIIEAVAFGSVALSYALIGIVRLLGPLFIPWLVLPRLSFLFWNWLQAIMQYSFYRVVAAALVYVVGGAVTSFTAANLNGNYTLAALVHIVPQIAVITLFSVLLALRISSVVADLFKGTSTAASDPIAPMARLYA